MSESLNRLVKLSKWGAIIAKVLMILTVVCMIILTICLIYIAANADLVINAVADGTLIINIPIETIDIPAAATVIILCVLVMGVIGVVLLYYTGRLFKNIYDNRTPFTDDNARSLIIMAVLIVICTIAAPIFDFALQRIIDGVYLQTLGFGAPPLFVALILYVLSLVFKHGAELQRESDHTL